MQRGAGPGSRLLLGTVVTVVAVVVIGALAGCTEGDSQARPAPTTSDPTPSARVTAEPTPEPPTLPAAAKGRSVASAKSFVRHYVDLLNYAANTGDISSLDAAAQPVCGGCRDYVSLFDRTYSRGGFLKTKGWSIDKLRLGGAPTGAAISVLVEATSAEVTFKKRRGVAVERFEQEPIFFSLVLRQEGQAWSIYDFSV